MCLPLLYIVVMKLICGFSSKNNANSVLNRVFINPYDFPPSLSLGLVGAQVPLVKTRMVTKLLEKWSQKICLRAAYICAHSRMHTCR